MNIIDLKNYSKEKYHQFKGKDCIILPDTTIFISPWICAYALNGKALHNEGLGAHLSNGVYVLCFNINLIKKLKIGGYKGTEKFDFSYNKTMWEVVVVSS